ncbi:hypothetical protein BC943DRAFT_340987 [Umbelopsis sp. AD052]|nr:hypothetical protein BC943DRAFT_340987 [Umbelopsis sp. AD052]
MYEEKSHQIKAILRGQRWISYTADLWTSPWKVPYFAITAHWINDEWKKNEVIIAFNRVEDKHTERALKMKAAIELTLASHPTCRLTDNDWKFLEKTMLVLKPFKTFTEENSGSQYATLNLVTASFVILREGL